MRIKMSRMINLNLQSVCYDKLRDAFITQSGKIEIAITKDALECYANRSLSVDESLQFLQSEKIAFSRMANSLSASEGIINITPYIVGKQEWGVAPADEGDEL